MLRKSTHVFTSESVSEGHPDKICDQISDAVLDAYLEKDSNARVACEVFATTNRVIVGGEITSHTSVDIETLVRNVIHDIGYDYPDSGFESDKVDIQIYVKEQSPDIALGVDVESNQFGGQGAGDQGMMFGYACKETKAFMPAPVMYSHKLLERAAFLRKSKALPWLRPDAKAQVTVLYKQQIPVGIKAVVLSHQHDPSISSEKISKILKAEVIEPVLAETGLLNGDTTFLINPTGRFVLGGPACDTGLTGRKIIVDTYGGMGRHGGGAFSGKDPSKVDRSGAYMARHVAKNLVAWGLCSRCEVQLSYAIGYPYPVSVLVDTFGTGKVEDSEIEQLVINYFDLSPQGIVSYLDLLRPIYRANVNYGHFGKEGVPWEVIVERPKM